MARISMSATRLLAPAGGLLLLALTAAASPADALDVRISSGPPVVASPSGVPVGVSVAGPASAQVVYVVRTAPRVLGVRDAPVGQPVVYVIEDGRSSSDEPRVRRVDP